MKKNIKCPCENNLTLEYEEKIDLDGNPLFLDEILNGSFMSYTCPACLKIHKPEFPIFISWKSKNLELEVLPELERGSFYRRKKEKYSHDTVIGFPEMADRLAVIKDGLEPVIIEMLKSYLLIKAEEKYPDTKINAWYFCKGPQGIEFHLDGIREGEVAVMRIPNEIYDKNLLEYKKKGKSAHFESLRFGSYLSVQNILRNDAIL